MVTFNRTDLEFILTQILQAEAGQPPVNPHLAFGLREVAGTDNNAVPGQETFGSADQAFPTATTQYFRTVTVNVDGTIFDPNPGVAGDTMTTTYASTDPSGIVVDSAPRTISNLISDISVNNPAALQAAQTFSGQLGDGYTVLSSNPGGLLLDPGPDGVFGTADDPAVPDPVNLFIGNITPDSGLSAPFNSWMTFFGQFFDHGLDLITKGGSGTVFIPLAPDDPLILVGPDGIAGTGDEVDPSQAFMVLTRATNEQVLPGADGVLGTSDDIHRNINTTTPFVDQNQTYTSHPSHQVFLREYMVGSDGQLHSSGKLLQHAQGPDGIAGTADDNTGMATWADVKANALKLGIILSDYNVGDVPLLATDAYGNFIPGANGFAQVVVRHADGTTSLVEGTAAGLDLTHPDPADPAASVVFTGHAFINDTAFFAVPFDQQTGALLTADADSVAGNVPEPGTYDNELLDAHYIAGDGRANENIALTAVHTIFHDEHNRLVEQTKELVRGELAKGDVSFALNWVLPGADLSDGIQDSEWNGDRLFQTAKLGTETQYQHLVFEEFARKIAPTVHLFGNTDIHLDPAIVSEFANAVYRFGHSMLDENVPMFQLNADGTPVIGPDGQPIATDVGLIQAFTNPLLFASAGAGAAAEIVQGTTHQIGSEIDEFVTGALRNNLLGLPLDLAALNIARGRDTGVAPLNLVRNEIFSQTQDTNLKPYASWDEFRQFLKHDASIVNFLAAYGTHASITSAATLADKRAAAVDLVLAGQQFDPTDPTQPNPGFSQDAFDFMHSLGAYANDVNNPLAVHAEWSTGSITGLDNVDLWIGGLAEKQNLFGGLLGSTFDFIFETQMESLQDGDRLYYLPRLEGTHFLTEIEANTFASLIMENTGAKHLPAVIFMTPEYTVEASDYFQKDAAGNFLLDADGHRIATDPSTWLHNPVTGAQLVEVLDDGTVHFIGDDNFLGNTIVLGGTEGDDRLLAGQADDDTVWGDGGNDFIDGNNGNDQLFGGTGDDIITDTAGDDIIHGDQGNDTISAGIGDDVVFGGDGNDFIDAGQGIDEVLGGLGNDIILGGEDDDELQGDEGDDWIEGGGGGDLMVGDIGAPTGQIPLYQGNDVLDGGAFGDRMQGFSGDDIMLGQGGFDKFEGRLGFDWASWEHEDHGVSIDMERREFVDQPQALGGDAIRDFFIETEAASGSAFSDFILGTNDAKIDPFNELSNVNLIFGLADYFPAGPVAFSGGNILFGAGGSDFLAGRGGNDIIDGDARLHVELTSREAGAQIIREVLYDQAEKPTFDPLTGAVLTAGDIDTAVFLDVSTNYQIAFATDADGNFILGSDGNIALVVTHLPPAAGGGGGGGGAVAGLVDDGVDTLYNIERLQFSDVTFDTGSFTGAFVTDQVAQGVVTIDDNGAPLAAATSPLVGDLLSVATVTDPNDPNFGRSTINDFEGVLVNGVLDAATAGFERLNIPLEELSFQWQYAEPANGDWVNIVGATNSTFTPSDFLATGLNVGVPLRVQASFIDGLGVKETVTSAPTAVLLTNPAVNHAPTVAPQTSPPGLSDTSARQDAPLGTDARPGIFLPLITNFTDDLTAANQLTYAATLADGSALDTIGLHFDVLTDAAGLVTAGRITGTPPATFTGAINVIVSATDAGGLTVTDDFIINVLPRPLAPVITSDGGDATAAVSVAENETAVTTVTATDPNVSDVLTFSITGGADAALFTIDATTGALSFVAAPNFEAPADADGNNVYDVIVRVSDGSLIDTQAIAVTVTDVNEAPVITSNGGDAAAAVSIAENATAVTTVTATDPDAASTLTFSISGGADAAMFAIDAATGALAFVSAPDFEAPTDADGDNIYDVVVQVADGSLIDTQAIAVSVTNVAGVTLTGANAADTLTGTGEEDTLIGLAGNDILNGLGGNDFLDGGAGADLISAGAGNDTIFGDAGNDLLSGEGGSDLFLYAIGDGADSVDGGADVDTLSIIGTAGNDTLNVTSDGAVLTSFEGGSITSVELVTADLSAGTDTLSYGTTTAAVAVNLATGTASGFSSIAGIENATGGSGNDALTGDAGGNALSGGAGDDTLSGGLGNDVLNGGAGIDTASYAEESDAIFVDLAAGTARRGSAAAPIEDTLAAIENVTGGSGGDTLSGNGGANTLDGGAGNDTLLGAGGADTLLGGLGDDTLVGDAGNDIVNGGLGNDTISYAFGNGADTVDGGAGTDSLNITGTAGADTLDVLFDGAGLTAFEGGTVTGVEAITADLLGGADRLSYAGSTAGVSVNLAAGTASGFASIAGIENVTGGSGADTLSGAGDALANNLAGGAGDDTYFADSNDTITEAAGAGTDSVFTTSAAFTLAANVENLTFTGAGNFTGTGNAVNNVITGGTGNNVLSGGGGADTLIGNAGVDSLNGDDGLDVLVGGGGNDVMNGGAGNDTFVFAAGFGNDVITGFDANPTGGQDLLDIGALGITAASFATDVIIADLGNDTLVTIGTDSILLLGVNGVGANAITQLDFILH